MYKPAVPFAVIFHVDSKQILFVYLCHSMGGKAGGMSAYFLKC